MGGGFDIPRAEKLGIPFDTDSLGGQRIIISLDGMFNVALFYRRTVVTR